MKVYIRNNKTAITYYYSSTELITIVLLICFILFLYLRLMNAVMLRQFILLSIIALTIKAAIRHPRPGRFRIDTLKLHNYYRNIEGSQPLVLTAQLNKEAQKRAEELADINAYKSKKGSFINDIIGESAYYSSGKVNANSAVDAWYDQRRYYICGLPTPPNPAEVGGYTQLAWKSSRLLGVGVAKSSTGTYVVCKYYPPGNIAGQYIKNVPSICWPPITIKPSK